MSVGIVVFLVGPPTVGKFKLGSNLFAQGTGWEFRNEWMSNITEEAATMKLEQGVNLAFAITPEWMNEILRSDCYQRWSVHYSIYELKVKALNKLRYP